MTLTFRGCIGGPRLPALAFAMGGTLLAAETVRTRITELLDAVESERTNQWGRSLKVATLVADQWHCSAISGHGIA